MNRTFCSNIKQQLIDSGFIITKCPKENHWKILDGAGEKQELMHNRSQGCLLRKAAKEFNLSWEK